MCNVSCESQSNYKIMVNQPANAWAGAVSVPVPACLLPSLFPASPLIQLERVTEELSDLFRFLFGKDLSQCESPGRLTWSVC